MTKLFSGSTSKRFGMFESFDLISYDGKLNKKLGLSIWYKSESSSLVDNPNGKISDFCLTLFHMGGGGRFCPPSDCLLYNFC